MSSWLVESDSWIRIQDPSPSGAPGEADNLIVWFMSQYIFSIDEDEGYGNSIRALCTSLIVQGCGAKTQNPETREFIEKRKREGIDCNCRTTAKANANIWRSGPGLEGLLTGLQAKLIVTDTRSGGSHCSVLHPSRSRQTSCSNWKTGATGTGAEAESGEESSRQSKVICGSLFTFGFYFLAVPVEARSKTVMDSRLKSKHVAPPPLNPSFAACKMTRQWSTEAHSDSDSDSNPGSAGKGNQSRRRLNWEIQLGCIRSGVRGAFLLFAYSSSKLKNKLIMRSCHWRQLQPQKGRTGGEAGRWKNSTETLSGTWEKSCWVFCALALNTYIYIYVVRTLFLAFVSGSGTTSICIFCAADTPGPKI